MALVINHAQGSVWSNAASPCTASSSDGFSGLRLGLVVSLVVHGILFGGLFLVGFFQFHEEVRLAPPAEMIVQLNLEPKSAMSEEADLPKPARPKSASAQSQDRPKPLSPQVHENIETRSTPPRLPPPSSSAVLPVVASPVLPIASKPESSLEVPIPDSFGDVLAETLANFSEAKLARAGGPPDGSDSGVITGKPQGVGAGYLSTPRPAYPREALKRRQEGTVILGVTLNKEGIPNRVDVKQSSGYTMLDEAALKAVLRWKFVPAKWGSAQVSTRVEVPVQFKLSQTQDGITR